MAGSKAQILTFTLGVALLVIGSSGSQYELSLVPGALLTTVAFGLVLIQWRQNMQAGRLKPQRVPDVTQQPAPKISEPTSPTPPTKDGRKLGLSGKFPIKGPKVRVPEVLIEHKAPILMVTAGLVLLVGALVAAGAPALPYALGIPGVLLLSLGSAILLLELFHRPSAGVRRFCMHCAFQMSTMEALCGRCGKTQLTGGTETKTCPSCTKEIHSQAKFCTNCGAGQAGVTLTQK